MAARRRASGAAGGSGSSGLLRLALAFALLLAGLALVVRRQSRALELVRLVERARAERTLAEAERAELLQRIDMLQSRAHVTETAGRRGMRLPSGNEIVILSEPGVAGGAGPVSGRRPSVALR
jgi:hypothetical protein